MAKRSLNDFRTIHHASTGSTNADAAALTGSQPEDFTIIWADEQRGGKGRFGREWHSPLGNLYTSFILERRDYQRQAGALSPVVGLAIARTVDSVLPTYVRPKVKWPNDVLIDDKKVSGNLNEMHGDYLVMGIGINIAHKPSLTSTRYDAACLNDFAETVLTPRDVLSDLACQMYATISTWREYGFSSALRDSYLQQMWRLGEQITVSTDKSGSSPQHGMNRGVDEYGQLVLECHDGRIRTLSVGDVS